jgi:type VII secretion-associated serine protease mycosin
MGVKQVWSAAGVVALTGALLLTSAPVASADSIRDQQWPLRVFDAERVWSTSQGQGVTVAVVDSGVDASHPDLTGQVLPGRDFSRDSSDPHQDDDGHGTGMASLIAGHGHGPNNASGVMGLAPKSKILPVKASEGENMDSTWPAGVRYAVDQGAKVINLSFNDGGAYPGSKGAKAIAYAQEHDVVVVAGAGNDGAGVNYPAALPGVVAVTAVDESLTFWDNSNSGKGVTLAAPGAGILSADPTRSGGYAEASGTSDATAYVSAIAALVRSKYPDLTAGQVINRLIKSASFLENKVNEVPDRQYGYGIARPGSALTMDIPAGPKEGPLAQAPSSTSTNSGNASEDNDSTTNQAKKRKKSSSGGILVIAGIAAVVVIGGIVFAVIRGRRNRGDGGPNGGTHPQGMGHPNQPPYPTTQPPYPTAAPGQSQNPNPYARQPPFQGQ